MRHFSIIRIAIFIISINFRMRRFVLPFTALVLTITACSGVQEDAVPDAPNQDAKIVTKADALSFVVSKDDLTNYCSFKTTDKNGNYVIKDVKAYPSEDSCLCYIINYSDGWEMVSSDKRTKPVLASSKTGSLCLPDEVETRGAWLESVLSDIKVLKEAPIEAIGEDTMEEMMAYCQFWDLLSNPEKYLEIETKSIPSSNPGGHYELVSTVTDTLFHSTINHLMDTHWYQDDPYNKYCPYRTDFPTLKAPAGCVAIAGAQLLYYLHDNYGFPVYAPDHAECTGNILNYQMSQTGSSSTIWNSMDNSDGDAAAILVANVGTLVGTQYSNYLSTANISDLVPNVFDQYDISCTYSSFDASEVSTELNLDYPSIIQADGSGISHCFIIDGARLYYERVTFTYNWVQDVPGSLVRPTQITYQYSMPFAQEFTMIWGYGASYDTGWYSATGDWEISGIHYNNGRKMISSYSINL